MFVSVNHEMGINLILHYAQIHGQLCWELSNIHCGCPLTCLNVLILVNIVLLYSTNHIYLQMPNTFGFCKCVCTCVRKHSSAFRTSLNWLMNLKCIWHELKIHVLRLPRFGNFDFVICERLVGLVSFEN